MTWTRLRSHICAALALVGAILATPLCDKAHATDQHSLEVLVSTLRSPIPPAAVDEARDFDDKLMSQGQFEGGKVYLITDERSRRVNSMVKELLEAMGEETRHWVVRILDTDPPNVNAFVTGGKYIYVYTGLIDQATSNDELCFVLSHELGHSLLQHRIRQNQDASSTVSGIAVLGALLSKKNREGFLNFAKLMTASYSRLDEEEADAIAVSITRRAGYDSLRGADFFSRMKREGDNAEQAAKENLQKMKQGFLQSQANCQKSVQVFNSSIFNQTSENAAKVNAICQDAENRRIQYNQQVVQVNRIAEQKASVTLYGDHPQDQNRIAAIAALNDYLEGRRELSTLDRYQQSYRVMVALREVDSVLLKVHQKAEIRPALVADGQPKEPSSLTLSEQLMDLKRAKDQGFISDSEYEQKRKQILNRY